MEIRQLSNRVWEVEDEEDRVLVTWKPKRGFLCECKSKTHEKGPCKYITAVINSLAKEMGVDTSGAHRD